MGPGWRHASSARAVIAAGLALAAVLAAGCGGATTTSGRTGPVWTPSASSSATAQPGDPGAGDWPTFGADAARSGVSPHETALTPATVAGLRRLWTVKLPDTADSTPILLRDLVLPDGTHRDILYLTTRAGTLVALDAATGAQLWSATTSGPRYTNSSPVADASRAYVYSYGLDGKLHKYSSTTGAEVRQAPWPVTVTVMMPTEKESSALNAARGFVYVTTAGYPGDAPPYQGHVVAVDVAHGTVHVFNTLCAQITHVLARGECANDQSGVWARAGVVVDPVTGNLFLTTGNGAYTGNQGGHDWGDSVLELSGDATRLLDAYTPENQAQLTASDTDLGSAAPALLPKLTNSHTPYLTVQAGKDGQLRLLNRQNLSGQGGPGHLGGALRTVAAPGGCAVLTQPAVWTDASGAVWLFVTNGCGTGGYRAETSAAGETTLRQVWSVTHGATSPVVAGGVLFAASPGDVFALDPSSGRQLWSSMRPSAGGTIGGIHWESPIVVGGRLYCTDEDGHLTAYGL